MPTLESIRNFFFGTTKKTVFTIIGMVVLYVILFDPGFIARVVNSIIENIIKPIFVLLILVLIASVLFNKAKSATGFGGKKGRH
jgi:hypothetical protein